MRLIESRLLMSDNHWPLLRDYMLKSGGFREWFLYYQGVNQWTKRFYEQQLFFLMAKELLSVGIYPDGKMQLIGYKLDEIARVMRDYEYADKECTGMILSGVTIMLKTSSLKNRPEMLSFKRPLESENGDPEGFERLMNLLFQS
ncbi:MAG: hypothetical protein ABRQ24_04460 [Syntrophomonadaceae bacterium]